MATDPAGTGSTAIEPIRTGRLEIVSMSVPFMEALVRGDLEAAAREIGAVVSPWLPAQLDHFLQYRLAQLASRGHPGPGAGAGCNRLRGRPVCDPARQRRQRSHATLTSDR